MPDLRQTGERVKRARSARGWSQAELARRAAVSRAAVSAIEIGRLVPSVGAALALAGALECSVETLFGGDRAPAAIEWAWPPSAGDARFWQAEVGGRLLGFPAEETAVGEIAHDGRRSPVGGCYAPGGAPSETLIVAGCDPAAGLLAGEYARQSGLRMIVLTRSSRAALALLRARRVHAAGVHLSPAGARRGNAAAVAQELRLPAGLLRVACWEEGVAIGASCRARSVDAALRQRLRWVGREPGSGARQCLDELFDGRRAPQRVAYDHRGVAYAVRCGWAEAGVCLRLVSDEAGLTFHSVRRENYDLAFAASDEGDPRIQALVRVVRSAAYRRLLGDMPGYDASDTGGLEMTSAP